MQRLCDTKLSRSCSRGNAALSVLVVALVLIMITGSLLQLVKNEAEAAYEEIRTRQLMDLTQTALQAAIVQERYQSATDLQLDNIPLQPGGAQADLKLVVKKNENAGLRLLTVTTTDSNSNKYVLKQLQYTPDSIITGQAQDHAMIAMGDVVGIQDTWSGLLYTSNDGAKFPDFTIGDYKGWSEVVFPTIPEILQYGFGGRMYYDDTAVLKLTKGGKVKGRGLLVLKNVGYIEDNCSFEDRVIIIANSSLVIGNNVKFNKALIICRSSLMIGTGCQVNGAIFVKGNATIGNGFTLTLDREAASPYATIIY